MNNFSAESMNKSKSFNDFCIISNSQDADEINKLKADNFNLRLRCYNLYNELNKSNTDDSIHNENNELKLKKYLDDYNIIMEENDLLKSENKLLKEKCDKLNTYEAQLFEIESLKIKYERLKTLFERNYSMDSMMIEIMKINDEQTAKNILSDHKILNLKTYIRELKKRILSNEYASAKLVSNATADQSKFIQDFNESVELSKAISTGCIGCNTLKVNYDKLMEMFMMSLKNVESLTMQLRTRDSNIESLEEELEHLKLEPKISEEKSKKFESLIKNSLISVVRKDQEKKSLQVDTKTLVDYYLIQIGELNRKIIEQTESLNSEMKEQCEILKSISGLIADTFKNIMINDNDDQLKTQLQQLKSTDDSKPSIIKRNWNILITIMNSIFGRANDISTLFLKNVPVADHHVDRQSILQKNAIRSFVDKYEEINKLANSMAEKSIQYKNDRSHESDLSSIMGDKSIDSFEYSPQYKISNTKNHLVATHQEHDSSGVSICYEKSFLNNTACQSFTGDYQSQTGSFDAFEIDTMMKKIRELGEVIHQYSALVDEMSVEEEKSILKINKSCSVMSFGDSEFEKSPDSVVSSDFSIDRKDNQQACKEEIDNLRTEILYKNEEFAVKRDECDRLLKIVIELETKICNANKQIELNNHLVLSLETKLHSLEEEREKLIAEHFRDMENLNFTLEESMNKTKEYVMTIDGLKAIKNDLVHDVEILSQKNDALILEKSKIESDFQEIKESLANMTKSFLIVTEQNDLTVNQLKKVYSRFSEFDVFENVESMTENEDVFCMLNNIEKILDQFHFARNRSHLSKQFIDSKKSTSNAEDRKCDMVKLYDLTNVTSFNSDHLDCRTVEANIQEIDFDMTGFKIKTVSDILQAPEKVLIMVRTFSQHIDDLKRRLMMRYEENKHLKSLISSTQCEFFIKEMDKFRKECEINNEKVSKRNSRK